MSDGADYEARELVGSSHRAGARGAVRALRFVRGGASLVSASDDGVVRRARCEDGAIEQVYASCASPVALDVTPDERALVGVGAGGEGVLWELASGDVMHRWALDLGEGTLLSPFQRDGISTCDAATVRCAPDGGSAWVCCGGRAYVVALADAPAVMRRMRDVIAVGHCERDGEVERLWFDGRGVHRSPLRAATHTLRGIEAHALRSESRRTPALFSPRGERLVLSTRLRVGIEGGVLMAVSSDATAACRADECTVLALADGLELWATGWRNDLSNALGALSLRVGDGLRARVATGIDLAEPERVTALGLTDSGRVAVGTSLGAIRVFDVDLATHRERGGVTLLTTRAVG